MTKYCDYLRGIIFVWLWPGRVTIVNKIVATLGSKKNFMGCVTSWITDSLVTQARGKIKYKVQWLCPSFTSPDREGVTSRGQCSVAGAGVSEVGLAWSVSGLWMSATGQPTLNTDNHLNMTLMSTLLGAESGDLRSISIYPSCLVSQATFVPVAAICRRRWCSGCLAYRYSK